MQGWSPPGKASDATRHRYDVSGGGWIPPGATANVHDLQYQMPHDFNPIDKELGYHTLVSPPGTPAPLDAINWTPDTNEVHALGMSAPTDKLNLSVIPSRSRLKPARPSVGMGQSRPVGVGADDGYSYIGTASDGTPMYSGPDGSFFHKIGEQYVPVDQVSPQQTPSPAQTADNGPWDTGLKFASGAAIYASADGSLYAQDAVGMSPTGSAARYNWGTGQIMDGQGQPSGPAGGRVEPSLAPQPAAAQPAQPATGGALTPRDTKAPPGYIRDPITGQLYPDRTVPPAQNPPQPEGPHYLTHADGSVWVIAHPGAAPTMVSGPDKPPAAQPGSWHWQQMPDKRMYRVNSETGEVQDASGRTVIAGATGAQSTVGGQLQPGITPRPTGGMAGPEGSPKFSPYDGVFRKYAGNLANNNEFISIVAAGTKAESGWNPSIGGDSSRSIGLFQINMDAHGGDPATWSDPDKAAAFMVPQYVAAYNQIKQQHPDWHGAELAAAVAATAERPEGYLDPNSTAWNNYRRAYGEVIAQGPAGAADYVAPGGASGPAAGSPGAATIGGANGASNPFAPAPPDPDWRPYTDAAGHTHLVNTTTGQVVEAPGGAGTTDFSQGDYRFSTDKDSGVTKPLVYTPPHIGTTEFGNNLMGVDPATGETRVLSSRAGKPEIIGGDILIPPDVRLEQIGYDPHKRRETAPTFTEPTAQPGWDVPASTPRGPFTGRQPTIYPQDGSQPTSIPEKGADTGAGHVDLATESNPNNISLPPGWDLNDPSTWLPVGGGQDGLPGDSRPWKVEMPVGNGRRAFAPDYRSVGAGQGDQEPTLGQWFRPLGVGADFQRPSDHRWGEQPPANDGAYGGRPQPIYGAESYRSGVPGIAQNPESSELGPQRNPYDDSPPPVSDPLMSPSGYNNDSLPAQDQIYQSAGYDIGTDQIPSDIQDEAYDYTQGYYGRPRVGRGGGWNPQIGRDAATEQVPPLDPSSIVGGGNKFGQQVNMEGFHKGVDLQAYEGTPVQSPVDGTVVGVDSDPQGLGLQIHVQSAQDGQIHTMAHLLDTSVKQGDQVRAGQPIGKVGESGAGATGPHLDYRVQDRQGLYLNPEPMLGQLGQLPPAPNTIQENGQVGQGQGEPDGWPPGFQLPSGADPYDRSSWTDADFAAYQQALRQAPLPQGLGFDQPYSDNNEIDAEESAGSTPWRSAPQEGQSDWRSAPQESSQSTPPSANTWFPPLPPEAAQYLAPLAAGAGALGAGALALGGQAAGRLGGAAAAGLGSVIPSYLLDPHYMYGQQVGQGQDTPPHFDSWLRKVRSHHRALGVGQGGQAYVGLGSDFQPTWGPPGGYVGTGADDDPNTPDDSEPPSDWVDPGSDQPGDWVDPGSSNPGGTDNSGIDWGSFDPGSIEPPLYEPEPGGGGAPPTYEPPTYNPNPGGVDNGPQQPPIGSGPPAGGYVPGTSNAATWGELDSDTKQMFQSAYGSWAQQRWTWERAGKPGGEAAWQALVNSSGNPTGLPPGTSHPGTGTPGTGTPGSGTPGTGTPGAGTPAPDSNVPPSTDPNAPQNPAYVDKVSAYQQAYLGSLDNRLNFDKHAEDNRHNEAMRTAGTAEDAQKEAKRHNKALEDFNNRKLEIDKINDELNRENALRMQGSFAQQQQAKLLQSALTNPWLQSLTGMAPQFGQPGWDQNQKGVLSSLLSGWEPQANVLQSYANPSSYGQPGQSGPPQNPGTTVPYVPQPDENAGQTPSGPGTTPTPGTPGSPGAPGGGPTEGPTAPGNPSGVPTGGTTPPAIPTTNRHGKPLAPTQAKRLARKAAAGVPATSPNPTPAQQIAGTTTTPAVNRNGKTLAPTAAKRAARKAAAATGRTVAPTAQASTPQGTSGTGTLKIPKTIAKASKAAGGMTKKQMKNSIKKQQKLAARVGGGQSRGWDYR